MGGDVRPRELKHLVSFALESAIFPSEIPNLGTEVHYLGAQSVSSNCARGNSMTARPFVKPKAILDS